MISPLFHHSFNFNVDVENNFGALY